jgi:tripartite-type tricarboxylate transporter receptor subunit TctC
LNPIQTQHSGRTRRLGRLQLLSALALACNSALASPAIADQVADFYRGRTINLMIGVNVGGSYDRDARLVARYLGSHLPGNPTIVPQNMTSIEDARRVPITAGASPKGSFLYAMPALLNEFLGTRFKIVAGYQGIASVYLALERGEVDSLGVTWGEFKAEKSDMLRDRKVRILVQSAPRADDLPEVPTVDELARNEADRGPMDFLLSGDALGRPLAAPPGTPAERVAALRAAFAETMKDPRFLHDVEVSRTEFGPIAGDRLQHAVEQILATPPQWIARAKVVLE